MISGRLEDKRDSVRLVAVQALKNTLLNAPRLDSLEGMPDFESVVKALQLLFISVDDSNEKIQDSILGIYAFFFPFHIYRCARYGRECQGCMYGCMMFSLFEICEHH